MPDRKWKLTYVFRCPICDHRVKFDDPGEPCCTGPSESSDDHPMEIMHLHSVERQEVDPLYAAKRAEGQLIMPNDVELITREARILVK